MPGQSSSPSEQVQAGHVLKAPQALKAGTRRGVQCLFPEGATSLSLPAVQYQTQGSSQASGSPQINATATPDSNLPAEAIKLLAHTVGGLSVHQAVASHLSVHGNSSVQAAKGFSSDEACSASTGLGDQPGSDSQHSYDRLAAADDELIAAGGERKVGGQWQGDLIAQSIIDNKRQNSAIQTTMKCSETQKQPVIVLAIGPEGGWVDSEIALLTNQYGFQVVTTAGSRILDTTTALISLVSLAVDAVSM